VDHAWLSYQRYETTDHSTIALIHIIQLCLLIGTHCGTLWCLYSTCSEMTRHLLMSAAKVISGNPWCSLSDAYYLPESETTCYCIGPITCSCSWEGACYIRLFIIISVILSTKTSISGDQRKTPRCLDIKLLTRCP